MHVLWHGVGKNRAMLYRSSDKLAQHLFRVLGQTLATTTRRHLDKRRSRGEGVFARGTTGLLVVIRRGRRVRGRGDGGGAVPAQFERLGLTEQPYGEFDGRVQHFGEMLGAACFVVLRVRPQGEDLGKVGGSLSGGGAGGCWHALW